MIATTEDLRRILCRYEGAVQLAEVEGDENAEAELAAARADLLDILRQAKVNLPEES